jgi:hypothetical protein
LNVRPCGISYIFSVLVFCAEKTLAALIRLTCHSIWIFRNRSR